MNLVTIIVPIYNEQENILRCVNVLKNQKNQKFNVIFIDDGSVDQSIENLTKCLDQTVSFNYKILQQKNKGAAAARKKGIQSASTEFIMIFDCDDKLSIDMVDEVYRVYEENHCVDIIMPNMYLQNKRGIWTELKIYTSNNNLMPEDCVKNSLNGWNIHGCFAIKKTTISKSYEDYKKYNISNENFLNNDEVITRLNFINSKKIVRSHGIYYYCYNSSSTTKKINKNRYLVLKNAVILNNIFMKNEVIKISVISELISVSWGTYTYMYKHRLEIKNIEEWKKSLKETVDSISYFKLFNKLPLRKKVQLTILKFMLLY